MKKLVAIELIIRGNMEVEVNNDNEVVESTFNINEDIKIIETEMRYYKKNKEEYDIAETAKGA